MLEIYYSKHYIYIFLPPSTWKEQTAESKRKPSTTDQSKFNWSETCQEHFCGSKATIKCDDNTCKQMKRVNRCAECNKHFHDKPSNRDHNRDNISIEVDLKWCIAIDKLYNLFFHENQIVNYNMYYAATAVSYIHFFHIQL